MSDNYPPGCPGPRRSESTFSCPDLDCEQKPWEVMGTLDLGTWWPDNDQETECPTCGKEGV